MQELMHQANLKKKFGQIVFLGTGQEFLDSIDKEDKTVTIIVHVYYEDHVEPCRILNECLKKLSKIYETVKFGAIIASTAGVSKKFKSDRVPASTCCLENFVRLTDDLGERFEVEDVQNFLVEHRLLEDKSLTPALVKSSAADESDDSD
ncbi:phosducin-like protein [Anthonomus grandis grandis]|uniref:phosducin-like protein n=1 Tax=Anthonomus grandis grandis TaxID=2921223 RepID=UPI00216511E8|nr:phosducin-like protein [Anthonomus grandis grandis]